LQRELAFRLAGLRGPRCAEPKTGAVRTPQTRSNHPRPKSPGRIAIQRDPAAHPGGATPPTAPSAPARPASHKPPAPLAPLNRAARRHLKYLQRRRDRAARPHP
jgi:hypothetical protein